MRKLRTSALELPRTRKRDVSATFPVDPNPTNFVGEASPQIMKGAERPKPIVLQCVFQAPPPLNFKG